MGAIGAVFVFFLGVIACILFQGYDKKIKAQVKAEHEARVKAEVELRVAEALAKQQKS